MVPAGAVQPLMRIILHRDAISFAQPLQQVAIAAAARAEGRVERIDGFVADRAGRGGHRLSNRWVTPVRRASSASQSGRLTRRAWTGAGKR
ncbi:hypothetical protein WR25_05560 [Diploscapter pachys]|uniref:Uncharacterized protein n=1 Tax=Diploscapter pachys TaxID=2018661 RepID=A0A2A2M6S7_9BILA|nr:hypothetical protein WR25_05560 [Diploscapter pachys]